MYFYVLSRVVMAKKTTTTTSLWQALVLVVVMVIVSTVSAAAAATTSAAAPRPVDRYVRQWINRAPGAPSFGNPYVGNGDIGVMFSSPSHGKDRPYTGAHVFSTGKNDFWTSEGTNYFNHNAGPTLELLPAKGTNWWFNATQDMGHAVLSTVAASSLNASESNYTVIRTSTITGEGSDNAFFTRVSCTRADKEACAIRLTLRDCCGNGAHFAETLGTGSRTGAWFRKENLHSATNGAGIASCDPDILYYNTERQFVFDQASGLLRLGNGSCPFVLDADNATHSPVVSGDCTVPAGKFALLGPGGKPNTTGALYWMGGPNPGTATGLCLQNAGLSTCGSAATQWTLNATTGYLQVPGRNNIDSCLLVVPDNSNNTLAAAFTVLDEASGNAMQASAPAAPVNRSVVADGVALDFQLSSGSSYTIVTSVLTLRDIGCAGTRAHTATCTQTPEAAATKLAAALVQPAALKRAQDQQAAFWAAYWNASAIDITGGLETAHPNATQLEYWYYGMQYSFGTNSRQGKVAPSLSGVLVAMDPVAWKDQLTIDYNFESNYWGAGSSNHLEHMRPYLATVTNPAVLDTMRQRANTSGVWNNGPGVHWPGTPGNPGTASCGGVGQCDVSRDLNHTVGSAYRGASWPSTMFPLGDGRPAPTDLATRFVGGLVATPLIQYYEYSRDPDALKLIYPVVRDNAEFYASYAMQDDGVSMTTATSLTAAESTAAVAGSSGNVTLPFTCAQEGCGCRDGTGWYWRWGPQVAIPLPNMTEETNKAGIYNTQRGQHDAHADIAFASASFRKAAEYAAVLGVDADLRSNWLDLLGRMPSYPTQTLNWVKNDSAVIVGAQLSGKPILVEARAGYSPAQERALVAAGNSTVTWPWCNVEYPITNFAAMWPTDEVGTLQTKDNIALLSAAKTTVFALNNYTGYTFKGSRRPFANTNGFGLSWPPAVRVSGRDDARELMPLMAFASEVAATNGIVSNGGGMLENMGAVQAVNDMLFQSHAGALRFFPVWDAETFGPASFTSLRGYGAFLASASIDATGTVAPVHLTSEVGGDCIVESPWQTLVVKTAAGASVPTKPGPSAGLFVFSTTNSGSYILSSA